MVDRIRHHLMPNVTRKRRFRCGRRWRSELLAKAPEFTGLKEKSVLVRETLKALIEREGALRLARLGAASAIWRSRDDGGWHEGDTG